MTLIMVLFLTFLFVALIGAGVIFGNINLQKIEEQGEKLAEEYAGKKEKYDLWINSIAQKPISEEDIKILQKQIEGLRRDLKEVEAGSDGERELASIISQKEIQLIDLKTRWKEDRVSSMELKELEYQDEVLRKEKDGQTLVNKIWLIMNGSLALFSLILGLVAYVFFKSIGAGFQPDFGLCWLASFFIITGSWFFRAFHKVPENSVWLMEVFGKFAVTWKAGPHFLCPFMTIKKHLFLGTLSVPLDMGGTVAEGKRGDVEFKDCSAGVHAIIFYRFFSPYHAVYAIGSVIPAIKDKMEAALRSYYGSRNLDEAIEGRADLDLRTIIVQDAAEAGVIKDWGVIIESIAVDNFDIPDKVAEQRLRKITAEKALEVARTEREQAEVDAETAKLRGGGEGKRLKALAEEAGVSVQEIISWDLTQKKFAAAEKSKAFILSEGSGNSGSDAAKVGATAAIAADAVKEKQAEEKSAKKK